MGRSRPWRKLVKKLRRKRIRTAKAKERDHKLQKAQEKREKLPEYAVWLSEQTALEIFQRQKEEEQRIEVNKKWEEAEKIAQIYWREQQERIAKAKAEKLKQEALIREEWDREQKKIKAEEERKKKEAEENERRKVEFLAQIDAYINGSGPLPEGAAISTETRPSEPDCPFFSKVGACKFWDMCSRNHRRPGISKILLFPAFFSHISLDHLNPSNINEYDTDVSLEYNDDEAYSHFREFYEDVVKELKTFGELEQFKVCCNAEPHLRGNVYAQYSSKRAAMKAYRALQGRYYGGKQIKVEFSRIPSWKNAICGLFQGARCSKGKNCNFLHVFWNPTPEFKNADKDIYPHRKSRQRSRSPTRSRRHWRWSESPEPVSLSSVSKKRDRDESEERSSSGRKKRKDNEENRSNEHNRSHRRAGKSEKTRSDNETSSDINDGRHRNSEHRKSKKRKNKRGEMSDRIDKESESRSKRVEEVTASDDEKKRRSDVDERKRKMRRKSDLRDRDGRVKSTEKACEETDVCDEKNSLSSSRKKEE